MGFCSDHLSKVSEEKSCLPGGKNATLPSTDLRVPPLHPSQPGIDDTTAPLTRPGFEDLPFSQLHPFLCSDDSREEQDDALLSTGSKRLWDDISPPEDILPAKKIRLVSPSKSILKKTKSRRRFSTPRRTFFDDNATVLEYATSRPPCEISYLMRVQSDMALCFDDGFWFKKTVYSSDETL